MSAKLDTSGTNRPDSIDPTPQSVQLALARLGLEAELSTRPEVVPLTDILRRSLEGALRDPDNLVSPDVLVGLVEVARALIKLAGAQPQLEETRWNTNAREVADLPPGSEERAIAERFKLEPSDRIAILHNSDPRVREFCNTILAHPQEFGRFWDSNGLRGVMVVRDHEEGPGADRVTFVLDVRAAYFEGLRRHLTTTNACFRDAPEIVVGGGFAPASAIQLTGVNWRAPDVVEAFKERVVSQLACAALSKIIGSDFAAIYHPQALAPQVAERILRSFGYRASVDDASGPVSMKPDSRGPVNLEQREFVSKMLGALGLLGQLRARLCDPNLQSAAGQVLSESDFTSQQLGAELQDVYRATNQRIFGLDVPSELAPVIPFVKSQGYRWDASRLVWTR